MASLLNTSIAGNLNVSGSIDTGGLSINTFPLSATADDITIGEKVRIHKTAQGGMSSTISTLAVDGGIFTSSSYSNTISGVSLSNGSISTLLSGSLSRISNVTLENGAIGGTSASIGKVTMTNTSINGTGLDSATLSVDGGIFTNSSYSSRISGVNFSNGKMDLDKAYKDNTYSLDYEIVLPHTEEGWDATPNLKISAGSPSAYTSYFKIFNRAEFPTSGNNIITGPNTINR